MHINACLNSPRCFIQILFVSTKKFQPCLVFQFIDTCKCNGNGMQWKIIIIKNKIKFTEQYPLYLYVQSSMKFKIYDDMTLKYIFIFIIFNLNNRMDLFKINGLTWWDKVNRPKKISQALVSIKQNPETLLPWPSCVRDYKNANMFFGP